MRFCKRCRSAVFRTSAESSLPGKTPLLLTYSIYSDKEKERDLIFVVSYTLAEAEMVNICTIQHKIISKYSMCNYVHT